MPLILLAIPSVLIGYFTIEPMLYGEFFKDAIVVDAARHPAMAELAEGFHGAAAMALQSEVPVQQVDPTKLRSKLRDLGVKFDRPTVTKPQPA